MGEPLDELLADEAGETLALRAYPQTIALILS
jgi:hypothetical protein